jgi:hypothetical protein
MGRGFNRDPQNRLPEEGFRKHFPDLEASAPNNGGVRLDSVEYEARVGIGHRLDRVTTT